jgi:hypothetical protein
VAGRFWLAANELFGYAVAAETAGQSHQRCSQADRFAVVKEKRRKGKVRRNEGIFGAQGISTDLAWVAQLVERVLGKDEVTGSIPVPGSRIAWRVG